LFFKKLILSDLIIIGGDELINDDYYKDYAYNTPIKHMFNKTEGKLIYLVLLFSKLFRKEIVIHSIGIGNINKKTTKFLIKTCFSFAKRIIVRDTLSKQRLIKILTNKRISILPDPSLYMKRIRRPIITKILKKENLKKKRYIVVTLKRDKLLNQKKLRIFSSLIEWLVKKHGYDIVLIPFSRHPYNTNEQDILVIDQIYKRSQCKDKIRIIRRHYHPSEIEGIISASKLVIGMRLHSIIFANRTNVPSICIPYSSKHKSVLDRLGFETNIIEKNDFTEDSLKHTISRVLK